MLHTFFVVKRPAVVGFLSEYALTHCQICEEKIHSGFRNKQQNRNIFLRVYLLNDLKTQINYKAKVYNLVFIIFFLIHKKNEICHLKGM